MHTRCDINYPMKMPCSHGFRFPIVGLRIFPHCRYYEALRTTTSTDQCTVMEEKIILASRVHSSLFYHFVKDVLSVNLVFLPLVLQQGWKVLFGTEIRGFDFVEELSWMVGFPKASIVRGIGSRARAIKAQRSSESWNQFAGGINCVSARRVLQLRPPVVVLNSDASFSDASFVQSLRQFLWNGLARALALARPGVAGMSPVYDRLHWNPFRLGGRVRDEHCYGSHVIFDAWKLAGGTPGVTK